MTVSTEHLIGAKDDIADLARAIETRDIANVSPDARQLLDELADLDSADWKYLLAKLDDVELQQQLGSVRRLLGTQIRSVGHTVSFDLAGRSLKIRLNLKAGEKSLESNQDLEDTLWIGAAVVEVVSDAMRTMEQALQIGAQQSCVGMEFETNLKKVEDALQEVRRIYAAIGDARVPEGRA